MGKGSAPSAPDPYQSAGAQYRYGTQAASYNAALNNVNRVSPTGSTTFDVTGYDPTTHAPQYTETQTLSAPQQALLTGQQNLQLNQQGAASNALNRANTAMEQPLPNTGDLQNFGSQAQQAAYKTATASMDPYWSQQQEQMDSQLRNAGSHPGDPAYDNAMKAFQANRSSAYGQAENQAFEQGLNAQGQMLNQSSQLRSIPLNEYQALSGGSQVQGAPEANPTTSQTNAPDIMSAFNNQYQGQLAKYNAGVASGNAALGDAAMLAAAFMMA